MRINVYSQELTDETQLVQKEGTNSEGQTETFYGVRMFLASAPDLHHDAADDDRSAVTFWLPRSDSRRNLLAWSLRMLAEHVDAVRREADYE